MRIDFHWHKYKYFPYERTLAHRELTSLFKDEPQSTTDGLTIAVTNGWEELASRTTYFHRAIAENGSQVVPLQTILEASANGDELFPMLNRQSTRYSAHGLHEYRGKFNPQVVHALGNILGLQPGALILDPFCGSGTTLLEAAHAGWNAIGVDLNPLAIQIARAKIASMAIPLSELHKQTELQKGRLSERIGNRKFDSRFSEKDINAIGGDGWEKHFSDFCYLSSWFTKSVLVQLAAILEDISSLESEYMKLILHTILSDIVREVSLQDPGDLRIRRRKSPTENAPAIPLYLDAVASKIMMISRARQHLPKITTTQEALHANICQDAPLVKAHPMIGKFHIFDAAITSPPYATALPYIDTQRLSLVLLGLIKADEIRAVERSLIGNREISKKERARTERALKDNSGNLPEECLSFCHELYESLDKAKDGFRKQNKPVLVYNYLTSMSSMFGQVRQLLKDNAFYALIVGRNRTKLGEKTFIIDTPHLLSLLAEQNGFSLEESIEFETYHRFHIHQVNSIRSETLILLRAS